MSISCVPYGGGYELASGSYASVWFDACRFNGRTTSGRGIPWRWGGGEWPWRELRRSSRSAVWSDQGQLRLQPFPKFWRMRRSLDTVGLPVGLLMGLLGSPLFS